jgi:hypothetical protein
MPSAFLEHRTRREPRRAERPEGSAFDTDALAFGVPDRLLQCVDEELIPVPPFPRLPQPWSRQVEVRPKLSEYASPIDVELRHRGPAPIPVSVLDLKDLQSGLEDERVGDHRIMRLIRELFNVQVLLDNPIGIRKERPRGAQRVPELVNVQLVVGRDER